MEKIEFTDEYFMKQALTEAQKAFDADEVPIGAVIVCENQIIARAHNLTERLCDVTAHAVMQAFTSASEYLGGKFLDECTLFVTLEPCLMCAGAAKWVRVGNVVYGASDSKHGCSQVKAKVFHPKTKVKKGILAEQCSELLRAYFKLKRKDNL